jgi:prophage antirepressor-like protein
VLRSLAPGDKQKVVIEAFKFKGRGGDNGVRIIVNREGANWLIAKSTRPEAERFKSWLFGEFYESIEDTVSYTLPERQKTIEFKERVVAERELPLTYFEALEAHYISEKEKNNLNPGEA